MPDGHAASDPLVAIDLALVRAAAARLRPWLAPTAYEPSPWLSSLTGRDVRVKWESQQRTGSFKWRGALNKLLLLRERGVSRVLAVSAGNHGQGVAAAAAALGMSATVVVPDNAAPTKVAAIRSHGAILITQGADYDAAEAWARRESTRTGIEFVSPYNDAEVIAGQGTLALEVLDPDAGNEAPDVLLVPTGGGGLLAGTAIVARRLGLATRVIGAQPSGARAMHAALAAGAIVKVPDEPTSADGLAGNLEAGSITFPLVRDHADGVLLVEEAALERAIAGLLLHDHQVVEGSGAAAVAALLDAPARDRVVHGAHTIAVLVTGRNIDARRLLAIATRRIDELGDR